MDKPFHEMSDSERIAYRIARNRAIENGLAVGKVGLTLEGIVDRLNAGKQRASYGAVAVLVGTLPRGLMAGKAKSPRYSWIVAATSSQDARRGWPTGYTKDQIHPDCYDQICRGDDTVIDSAEELKRWLDLGEQRQVACSATPWPRTSGR